MGRERTVHRCRQCDHVASRWSGRCPSCGEWNSLVEEAVPADSGKGRRAAALTAGHPVEAPRP
ncbi:MAG TPA: hypothetical protein VG476_05650, partial [Acidimicrobiales bacterium]|nr:hypothetical protein [Acidimicrobiales bacterium]